MINILFMRKKVQKKREEVGGVYFSHFFFLYIYFFRIWYHIELGGIKKEGNIYLGEMKNIDR
jgi:hypothetical protein